MKLRYNVLHCISCIIYICIHVGLNRVLKGRRTMLENQEADWAMGEAFAFGSLLMEGTICTCTSTVLLRIINSYYWTTPTLYLLKYSLNIVTLF